MANPLVACIVVVYRQSDAELIRFLTQLDGLTYQPRVLVLVNNDRSRGLEHLVPLLSSSRVEVVTNDANGGWTAGVNGGARAGLALGADYFLFLNTDIAICSSDLIEELLAPFAHLPRCGLVSPTICYQATPDRVWYGGATMSKTTWVPHHQRMGRRWRRRGATWRYTGLASGCCCCVPARVWAEVGGADTRLFMYFDDADLSLRARRLGWSSVVVDQPLILHDKHGRRLSALEAYYFGRNPFVLMHTHGRAAQRVTGVLAQLLAAPFYLHRCDGWAARRRYLAGLRDGLLWILSSAQ